MPNRLDTLKPAAPARVHLVLAAAMWTVVGAMLLLFGTRWARAQPAPQTWWLLAGMVAIGLLKAKFVLGGVACRTIERIRTRGDGRCVGGFLSVRSWAFVALMMALGYSLRHGLLPRHLVGLLYVAVGVALLSASCKLWLAFCRHTPNT